jgi:hypothetical protein
MESKGLTPKKSFKVKTEEQNTKEINNYIQNRVMPVLAPLQMELLAKQPPNLKEYCVEWLKKYSTNRMNKTIPREIKIPKSFSATKSPKRSFNRREESS